MKHTDNWEEWLKAQQEDLEALEPRANQWQQIANALDQQKKPTNSFVWVWKVAAMLLLVLSAALLVERNYRMNPAEEEVNLASINPKLQEVETYYTQLISERQLEMNSLSEQAPELEKTFASDLQTLDLVYQQLKETLINNNNDPKIQDAMILNLQLRISILNQQVQILQQVKQVKNNETTSI